MSSERTTIFIPKFTIEWTEWYHWNQFKLDLRTTNNGVPVPNLPGVYEAKFVNEETMLTIGKASNLRMRVKQGLVKGKVPHSSGDKIRKFEDTENIIIRWAVTERPSCVEEELHIKYKEKFKKLPKYTERT